MRAQKLWIFTSILVAAFIPSTGASVLSSPSINLDGAVSSSLATTSPTRWNDLATGSLQFTIGSNTSYNSLGGGSLTQTSAGTSGAYLAPTAAGSPSNPIGNISVFTWIYFTSWNVDWNIISSRWFSDTGGTGGSNDFHFAVRTKGSNHRLNLYTTSTSDIDGSTNLSLNKWYLVGFTLGSGVPKFYVNGKYDTPTVTSGVTRTAYSTSYLFVGDYRTTCSGCSFNGYMAKYRMWNSVLGASTILSDYRNEATALGYSTTTTLGFSSTAPKYRTTNLITATVPSAGRVTFLERGKIIKGCRSLVVSSTTATCSWKPALHGSTTVSATYTPDDLTLVPSSNQQNLFVTIRSQNR